MASARPISSFSCGDRTLMAQRLDLDRLKLTGEPIRVAEGVDKLGAGRRLRRISERYGGVLVRRPGHHPADVVSTRRHCGGHAGTAGGIHERRPLARWAAGRARSVRPDARDLAPRRGARHRDQSDVRRRSTNRRLSGRPTRAAFVFAAARDTPPNLYLKRIGTAAGKKNACSARRLQTLFRRAGPPMGASSRT